MPLLDTDIMIDVRSHYPFDQAHRVNPYETNTGSCSVDNPPTIR